MQKATKHHNFAGSGTFQPLCTKVHHAAPTGAEVLLWCTVMHWCTIIHYCTIMHWCTIVHWCTIMHWCTILHWCTIILRCTLVNKKPPGALVQKYICGTLLAQKKFTGAHALRLVQYFALVHSSAEALPILLLLQCKSALLTLV